LKLIGISRHLDSDLRPCISKITNPQLQGKVEAYNKIVKNEFISVEQISSIDEGKVRYDMFVKGYNDKSEHGGINGLTPSEMFLQTFNRSPTRNNTKQGGVHNLFEPRTDDE
jgi:hypothetical protein